jgi:hypothetical protein
MNKICAMAAARTLALEVRGAARVHAVPSLP